MTVLEYLVSGEGDVNAEELAALMRAPNSSLFLARRRWEETVWQAYKDGLLQRGTRALRFPVSVFTMDPKEVFLKEDLEIPLDTEFFAQVILLYGTHGLAGIEAMLASLKEHIEHTRTLVRETVKVLETLIARELLSIEAAATTLALAENRTLLAGVNGFLGKFKPDDYHKSQRLSVSQKEILYESLKVAHRLQGKIAALGKSIQERNRKDGGDVQVVRGKRERDHYRKLLAEIYLKPQRQHIAALEAVQEKIGAIFMPALLILNALDDDILNWAAMAGRMDSLKAEVKFDAKMYAALAELKEQLELDAISLSNPGVSARLLGHLSLATTDRRHAGGVHDAALDKVLEPLPSVREFIKSAVLQGGIGVYYTLEARTYYSQSNRVLGRPAILARLQERAMAERPCSFTQAVLLHFRLDLERRIEGLEQTDAFYESIWHWIDVCLALAGLLLATLAVPFGPGAIAVPAALTTVLAAASMTTCVLSLIMMARGLLQLFAATDAAGGDIRKQLIELGQLNRAAFIEVGKLVVRRQALFKGATTDLVKQVIELAVAHKLKPVAFALEMQGNLDDMETLAASF